MKKRKVVCTTNNDNLIKKPVGYLESIRIIDNFLPKSLLDSLLKIFPEENSTILDLTQLNEKSKLDGKLSFKEKKTDLFNFFQSDELKNDKRLVEFRAAIEKVFIEYFVELYFPDVYKTCIKKEENVKNLKYDNSEVKSIDKNRLEQEISKIAGEKNISFTKKISNLISFIPSEIKKKFVSKNPKKLQNYINDVNMFASIYSNGHFLLPHDDLVDKRMFTFTFYLNDIKSLNKEINNENLITNRNENLIKNRNEDEENNISMKTNQKKNRSTEKKFPKNEGNLQIYSENKNLYKSIEPKTNRLVIFQVSKDSLHSVDINRTENIRKSITGWLNLGEDSYEIWESFMEKSKENEEIKKSENFDKKSANEIFFDLNLPANFDLKDNNESGKEEVMNKILQFDNSPYPFDSPVSETQIAPIKIKKYINLQYETLYIPRINGYNLHNVEFMQFNEGMYKMIEENSEDNLDIDFEIFVFKNLENSKENEKKKINESLKFVDIKNTGNLVFELPVIDDTIFLVESREDVKWYVERSDNKFRMGWFSYKKIKK